MMKTKELAAQLMTAAKEVGNQRVILQLPDANGNWYDVDLVKVLVDPENKTVSIKAEGDAIIDPQYHHSIDDMLVDEKAADPVLPPFGLTELEQYVVDKRTARLTYKEIGKLIGKSSTRAREYFIIAQRKIAKVKGGK